MELATITEGIAQALWYRASEAEIGIAITIKPEDKVSIRELLYRTRQKLHDPSLEALILLLPTTSETEIWIAKKATQLDA